GWTDSPDFPAAGPPAVRGRAIFAARFAADGARVYSTFIGAADGETRPAIAADSQGNAYIAGSAGKSGMLVKLAADGERHLAAETAPGLTASHGTAVAWSGAGGGIVEGTGTGQAYAARVSTCAFHFSQAARAVAAGGGAGTLNVETSPECDWNVESSS